MSYKSVPTKSTTADIIDVQSIVATHWFDFADLNVKADEIYYCNLFGS